jgi:hypothetical protein
MGTNKRCIDDAGLVHYAFYAGQKNRQSGKPIWAPWCDRTARIEQPGGGRARVTCLLCLRERSRRGGPGGLLPYVG